MKEIILHYFHIMPLFLIMGFTISNQLFRGRKIYSYFRKYYKGIQLLLISIGMISGSITHSHIGILGCNLCVLYSAILGIIAISILRSQSNKNQLN